MHDLFYQRRVRFHFLWIRFFIFYYSSEAATYKMEVSSGAALLQISQKSSWSNRSIAERKDVIRSFASSYSEQLSLTKSTLNYCNKYWQGRKVRGECAPACKYPETWTGADWNGGKQLQDGVCTYLASKIYEEGRRYCGEGPDYTHDTGLDCRGCAESAPQSSSFHDIVGGDGVYMISLNCRTERFDFSADRLEQVGITPTFFAATEASAPAEQLAQGCAPKADAQCASEEKPGDGCVDGVEQAIADSHRRVIETAQSRNAEWTAILEDDSIPAMSEDGLWTERLMKVWSQIPEGTDVVRLGWCGLQDPDHRWSDDSNNFVIADTPDAGGCTHAYVVRREALPKLSALFPCCCAVDCCFKFGMPAHGITMVNIDAIGSKEYIAGHMTQDWGNAYGIMMQAKGDLPTFRGR
mmetsp:Transcript_109374/g.172385  ORF Transcript_109374/g.172385 Transcript_109374/m.172385 type:complete len:410 (-) Transcript_109374:96-1325(-)